MDADARKSNRGNEQVGIIVFVPTSGDHRASIVQVQAWIGHAEVDTPHKSWADEAKLLAEAFEATAAPDLAHR